MRMDLLQTATSGTRDDASTDYKNPLQHEGFGIKRNARRNALQLDSRERGRVSLSPIRFVSLVAFLDARAPGSSPIVILFCPSMFAF